MRRTYISPEYSTLKVFGTYNMIEESNFFLSKMLEIEDTLYLTNQDLVYYQNSNSEQVDFSLESTIPSLVYSTSADKEQNHTLILDESQSQYQRDTNTKWILEINLEDILNNYIFAVMKKYRTFEGMKKTMTRSGDVNVALQTYIKENVLNRYKFKKVDLYISYKDLRNQNILRYKTYWNPIVYKESNKVVKFQSETSFNDSSIKIYFSQEKDSSQYSFEYFYNILFEKL